MRDIAKNRAVWHSSAADYDHTGHLMTNSAEIPWISGGSEEEWLLLDLGAVSVLQEISIQWGEGFASECAVELSEDGETFTECAVLCSASPDVTDAVPHGTSLKLTEAALQGQARYVRLRMRGSSGDHFIIYQVSVFGENDLIYTLPDEPAPLPDGTQILSGGNWRLQRAPEVPADGAALSRAGFDDSDWLPAVVPGTALVSYLQAGAVPDPFYDDDQFQVSEEYFTADFWYRNHFRISAEQRGRRVFLNFEQINWKADVYFNGTLLENALPDRKHSIEGAFIRAKFDVTALVRFGEENFLAVRILKNATPGAVTTQGLAFGPGPNGGLLGADNPTLHASVGWDWLPTIRGRNTGILGEVSLQYTGEVQLKNLWMETELALQSESTAIPAEDLMLGDAVTTDGKPGPVREWHGKAGGSFVVDFGKPVTVGAVTMIWGTQAGGAAADLESRYPESFRLEVSEDALFWRNLDYYPGGEVPVRWMGLQKAGENPGKDELFGHAISDTLPGATAVVTLNLTRFGRGIENREIVQPDTARYLRFTVLKARSLNGVSVDTIVREMRVYRESPQEVEQGTDHHYELDTSRALLRFRTELKNAADAPKDVRITGRILPDGPTFEEKLTLPAKKSAEVCIPMTLENPRLWWPNTYGNQALYTCEVQVSEDGGESDRKSFEFGVRRFDYPIDGGFLTLYCNGARIVAKGGNWGIDDGLKRDTREVLFDKVRLHAEQNMTMIRNWVGMTSHPAFYEACDRYGILIWDDFWLANPVDGPEPDDPAMFLENAADKIRAVRSHPSLAFYCGRNEGNPRDDIHQGLDELTKTLDGTRIYFPNSASEPVGSGGGYQLAKPGQEFGVKQYFNDVTSAVLRSERGIPNVPEYESVLKFVRKEHLWPISETWALHDWTYHMNGPANTYMEALKNVLGGDFAVPEDRVRGQAPQDSDPVFREYKAAIAKMCAEAGESWDVRGFFRAAQLINYDHHRGLFDAVSARRSNGLLMWMSQSSWPSFMWQTYDYYLYANGGFYGAKAGCQPTRAFFDPRSDRILLANATAKCFRNLTVKKELFSLYGEKLVTEEIPVEELLPDAAGISLGTVDFSVSDTDLVFLRLSLADSAGRLIGFNTYWHNRRYYQDYRALQELPKTEVSLEILGRCTTDDKGRLRNRVTLAVKNGAYPALSLRIRALLPDGSDLLPVFFSDNYLLMMPGEERIITAEYKAEAEEPAFRLEGWNLKA